MVEVDRPNKAQHVSYHKEKPYKGKASLSSHIKCVCIVKAKYQNAPSKAVVEVDQPMKVLSMQYTKLVLELLSCFVKIYFF